MQSKEIESQPRLDVAYSRAAFRALVRLDAPSRMKVTRLVSGVAANASHITQHASRTFSADVDAGLRIVFLHDAHALTVLALTGENAQA